MKNLKKKKKMKKYSFKILLKHHLMNKVRTEVYDLIIKIAQTPNKILKIFLFLFVCIASALASYTVIQSIISYFSYQVLTTSRTLYETPANFPKITICNSHIFTTDYALDLLKKSNDELYPNISILNPEQMSKYDIQMKLNFAQNIHLSANGKVANKNFTNEDRKKLSLSLDDTLLRCKFNYKSCTSADFLWTFDSYYGNCYIFNSGFDSSNHKVDLKQSSVAGFLFGLQLDLYVNYNDDLNYFRHRSIGKGILLRIDNASYLKDHNIDGIKLSPGYQADISIERSFKFTMAKPYSDCEIENHSPGQIDSDLYNLISHSPYQYTQQLCFTQCYQKNLIKACNCASVTFVSLFTSTPRCETLNQTICLFNFFTYKYLSNDYVMTNCLPLCPLECNITKYRTSLRYHPFNGHLYVDYVKQNPKLASQFVNQTIDANAVSYNVVSMNIFYESLSYEYSDEVAQIDIVALLANIGGNLGLFLGVSLLSICELIEILIEIFILKFKK